MQPMKSPSREQLGEFIDVYRGIILTYADLNNGTEKEKKKRQTDWYAQRNKNCESQH
jgi:hypothetical protein